METRPFFGYVSNTIIKKHSDYQRVTFQPVAASRRVTLETLTGSLVAIVETLEEILWKPLRRLRRKTAIPRGGNPGSYSICHV